MEKSQIIDYEIEIISDSSGDYEPGDCYWATDLIDDYAYWFNENNLGSFRKTYGGLSLQAIIGEICADWGLELKETGDIIVQYEQRTYHTHKDIYRCD